MSTIPSAMSDSECSLRTTDSSNSMSSEDSDVILIKSPALPKWLKWSAQCSPFSRNRPDEGAAVPTHGAYDSSLESGNSTTQVNLSDKLQLKSHIWKHSAYASYRTASSFFNEVSVRVVWSMRKVGALATTALTPIWSAIDSELQKFVDSLSEPPSLNCSSPSPLTITQPSQQHSVVHVENPLPGRNSSVALSIISYPSHAEDSGLSNTTHSADEACV